MKLKVKKLHPDATLPTYGSKQAAAMDLYALNSGGLCHGEKVIIHTGIALEIPQGYFGLIRLRSGVSWEHGLVLVSSGVVDEDYRGEIQVRVAKLATGGSAQPTPASPFHWGFNQGDRVAQMVLLPYPVVTVEEVRELGETQRGEGGFGSTGK
jgi:dUTP pyrophosphatase